MLGSKHYIKPTAAAARKRREKKERGPSNLTFDDKTIGINHIIDNTNKLGDSTGITRRGIHAVYFALVGDRHFWWRRLEGKLHSLCEDYRHTNRTNNKAKITSLDIQTFRANLWMQLCFVVQAQSSNNNRGFFMGCTRAVFSFSYCPQKCIHHSFSLFAPFLLQSTKTCNHMKKSLQSKNC